MESENSPLLQPSVSHNVRFYTSEDISDETPPKGDDGLVDERIRRPSCRSWMSGADESDAEYMSSVSRSSRTLPNNAPAPYVLLGLCCAVLAGLCFTSSNVMVKYIPEVNSWQLLFVRCMSQNVAMVPIMIIGKHHILGTPDWSTRWRVAAQGVLGGLLLLFIFEAVARLPLGDCTAIFFSAPAFTMVMSYFVLRDHCGLWRILVVITLLSGVLILSRPESLWTRETNNSNSSDHINASSHHFRFHRDVHKSNGDYDIGGLLSAIAVPFLSAWIVIITRQAKHVHYSVFVFWFGVGGLIVSFVGMFGIDDGPLFHQWDDRMWILSFMVALVGIIGSILMTKAICWVTPSKVMVVRSFEVVAAYILQVTVFDIPTHWTDLAGTICVMGAVLSMSFEDCIMEKIQWKWM